MPNTNSKNSSFSDVSSRSSNFDSRSSICIGGEAGYSLSSCSAEERTGLQSICNSPPDIDSSAGAAKNTATLRIQNTDQNIETSRNINSLEESAGGTFPNDGTISTTDIPIINVPPRVKSPKKKVRKSVKVYSEPFIIPPGHVWLAGDNTANSTDSR